MRRRGLVGIGLAAALVAAVWALGQPKRERPRAERAPRAAEAQPLPLPPEFLRKALQLTEEQQKQLAPALEAYNKTVMEAQRVLLERAKGILKAEQFQRLERLLRPPARKVEGAPKKGKVEGAPGKE